MRIAIAILCLALSGCGAYKKQTCMTRLEVLSLMMEATQREQRGMRPAERADILQGQLSLERIKSGNAETAYEKCQRDFRDLLLTCARKERGRFEEAAKAAAEKTNAEYAEEIKALTKDVK